MSNWIEILQCPTCKNTYSVANQLLTCRCEFSVPFKEDIIYFNERHNRDFKLPENDRYIDFLKFKVQRPAIDLYAAFQPFNESTRAIYPFINIVKNHLKPGDWILDTWCRTGWTSNWLSSLFPDQNILSVWEGNRDVLGYDGFNYWFNSERKNPNQYFIFLDLSKPLPFTDSSFRFINGLETLHRYNQTNIIHEIERITKDDGITLYPHNHLTNSEPNPYFDRGEIQRHGTVYDRYFQNYLAGKNKHHFILSEIGLFEHNGSKPIINNPAMTDYNALIGIMPEKLSDSSLEHYELSFENPDRLYSLVNPFLKINLSTCLVTINHEFLNGAVGRMLQRHPVYEERINRINNTYLSIKEIQIIYWSRLAKNLAEIAELININNSEIKEIINALNAKDILQTHLLNRNGARMYYFQSNQNFYLEEKNQTINYLFENLNPSGQNDQYLILDGEEASGLTVEEMKGLVDSIRQRLISAGYKNKDTICIHSALHFEAILLFWAGTMNGLNVEVINSDLPKTTVEQLVAKSKPKLVFVSKNFKLEHCETIVLDNEKEYDQLSFSDWLNADDSEFNLDKIEINPDQVATTLYTSGSTGLPNAIALTHKMLVNSAKQIVDTFKWTNEDTFIATSEIDSMSGLRNTCLATIYSSCKIIIPELDEKTSIFKIINSIKSNSATVISTTPAVLKQFVKIGESVKSEISTLSKVLCTASVLTENLIAEFHSLFGKKILNYYGLTETSGICISTNEETDIGNLHYLGKPVAGIVQLVNEDDEVISQINTPGEIRVYGNNVIDSYAYNQEAGYKFRNGWIYTGDIASINEQGYFEFVERKRHILKNNFGETIYLKNVRSKINSLEEVEDSYVSTILDNDLETMVALIHLKNGDLNTLQESINSNFSLHEKPQRIVLVDKIPYNSRGKVDNDIINRLVLAHEI